MSVPGPRFEVGKYGPTLRGGSGRPYGISWGRIAKGLVGTLTAFAVLVAAAIGTLVYVGETSLEQVAVPGLRTEAPVQQADTDDPDITEATEVENFLLVGSDSRVGLTDAQLVEIGTTDEDNRTGLTDTIMLVQLDPNRDQVGLLSFPRDLLVARCDGSRGRINAAFAVGEAAIEGGGPACLVETVTDLTRIPIDHYVQVDFAGFIDVVDALGGVSFFVEEAITDVEAGLDVPAGCVTFDGARAIGFVRARKFDPAGDFGRVARQQRFVRELVAHATSAGTLANYPRLLSVVRAAASAVDTDDNLSFEDMARLAYSLRDLSPDTLDTRTVPAVNRTVSGAAYVVAIEDEAEALFAAYRDGEAIPDDVGLEPPAEIELADVPAVDLLNGAGIAGLAAEAALALEERGLEVGETGNADSFDFTTSQVIYPPDRLEEAQLLATALGDLSLVPGEAGQSIQLVLGNDFDVTALPEPAEEGHDSAASPDATASPDVTASEDATGSPDPGASLSPQPEQTFPGAADSDIDC